MRLLTFSPLLLLCACKNPAEIKPTFIHSDAHSSGNLVLISSASALGVSAGLSGGVRLWNLEDGRLEGGWKAHDGPVNGLAIPVSQDSLITGGWDGSLKKWNLSGQLLEQNQTGSPITSLVYNPVAGQVVTGHADARVRYWIEPGLQMQSQLILPGDRIKALAYHSVSETYAASDIRGNVWVWTRGQTPRQIADLPAYIRTLTFSAHGDHLFGGSWFNLYRWEVSSGDMRVLDTDHNGIIADIAWSEASDSILSISRQTDSSVLALDPVTGGTRTDFGQHELCGASIDISSDGKYLMTTSDDASVRIWQLEVSE